MKYALVNGVKKTAELKEVGICICCNNPVRAYCGLERVHHWKHMDAMACDSWSEGETEWHREWKNHFDVSQQEIIRYDPESGEKHIADVYIESRDLVLEFQHSPIHIDEIKARESFYKKMIWIVDVQPYKDNISFFKEIGDAFNDCRHVYMESRIRQMNELSQQGKQKEVEELMNDDEIYDCFESLENKYFQDYSKKKSNSQTANNLLNILEKEREKARHSSQSLAGYSLSEEYEDSLLKLKNKHLDQPYFLMVWKFKQKKWNHAKLPLFFDIGDEFMYRCLENIKYGNGLIVKKYPKKSFISYYKDR